MAQVPLLLTLRRRVARTARLSPAAILLLATAPLLFGQSREPKREEPTSPDGLRLELKTDKASYKRKEPIILTAAIWNDGAAGFYVTPNLKPHPYFHMMVWSEGGLRLEIRDSTDRPVEPARPSFIACGIWTIKRKPVHEFLRATRSYIAPGELHVSTAKADDFLFDLKKPGIYRLRLVYWEPSYRNHVSEEEFEEARKELKGSWWANVQSDWVEIEILP